MTGVLAVPGYLCHQIRGRRLVRAGEDIKVDFNLVQLHIFNAKTTNVIYQENTKEPEYFFSGVISGYSQEPNDQDTSSVWIVSGR